MYEYISRINLFIYFKIIFMVIFNYLLIILVLMNLIVYIVIICKFLNS